MSALDAVLARPGVYRWDGADDDSLWAEALERDDVWLVAVGPAASKEDLLASFAESLRFPDWFGHNYDALEELLADADRVPGSTVVLWRDWSALAQADPDAFATFVEILTERCAVAPGFGVLLHGPGPALDVPDLGRP